MSNPYADPIVDEDSQPSLRLSRGSIENKNPYAGTTHSLTFPPSSSSNNLSSLIGNVLGKQSTSSSPSLSSDAKNGLPSGGMDQPRVKLGEASANAPSLSSVIVAPANAQTDNGLDEDAKRWQALKAQFKLPTLVVGDEKSAKLAQVVSQAANKRAPQTRTAGSLNQDGPGVFGRVIGNLTQKAASGLAKCPLHGSSSSPSSSPKTCTCGDSLLLVQKDLVRLRKQLEKNQVIAANVGDASNGAMGIFSARGSDMSRLAKFQELMGKLNEFNSLQREELYEQRMSVREKQIETERKRERVALHLEAELQRQGKEYILEERRRERVRLKKLEDALQDRELRVREREMDVESRERYIRSIQLKAKREEQGTIEKERAAWLAQREDWNKTLRKYIRTEQELRSQNLRLKEQITHEGHMVNLEKRKALHVSNHNAQLHAEIEGLKQRVETLQAQVNQVEDLKSAHARVLDGYRREISLNKQEIVELRHKIQVTMTKHEREVFVKEKKWESKRRELERSKLDLARDLQEQQQQFELDHNSKDRKAVESSASDDESDEPEPVAVAPQQQAPVFAQLQQSSGWSSGSLDRARMVIPM
jgi:hypothetical protein